MQQHSLLGWGMERGPTQHGETRYTLKTASRNHGPQFILGWGKCVKNEIDEMKKKIYLSLSKIKQVPHCNISYLPIKVKSRKLPKTKRQTDKKYYE